MSGISPGFENYAKEQATAKAKADAIKALDKEANK